MKSKGERSGRGASSRIAARTGSARGQSLVEFAFLLPLLVLMLLGAIDVGRYAYFSIGVGNAAHAGAFYASQNSGTASTSSGNLTAVKAAACQDFNSTNTCALTVSIANGCKCDHLGTLSAMQGNGLCEASNCPNHDMVTTVTVTASGTFTPIFAFPGIKLPTVTRSATMLYGN